MATSFDNMTLQRAVRKIPALTEGHTLNELFVVKKDHWQSGMGYIGPSPQPTEEGYQEFMVELARIFVGVDAMLEVLRNRLNGVIGKEPNFFWTPKRAVPKDESPTEEEKRLIDEANALSTNWWNEYRVHQVVKEIVFTLLWAERAGYRLYVPSGLRLEDIRKDEETGEILEVSNPYIEADTFEEALSYVFVEHPHPKGFAVVEDPDTKEKLGVLRYQKDGKVFAELTYYDRDIERTILRIIGAGRDESEELELGPKRLTMYEVYHTEFLTAQIRQLQRALNFATTLIPHNMGTTSFVERTFLNAQMPGDWEYDKEGRKIPGTFTPKPYHVGASSINFVTGIEVESEDAEGGREVKLANPQINYREPSPLSPVIEGKDDIRRELFRLADQEHLASESDAEASGIAYEQRRAKFIASLNETASPVAEIVRNLIEAKMAMAEDIMGDARFTKTLRVECQLRLDRGPISADDQRANWEAVEKNQLPMTEALSRNGVDDPDAAVIEINSSPAALLSKELKLAEAVAAWTTAGASLEGALKKLQKLFPDELTDEDIRAILAGAPSEETGVEDPIVDPTGEGDDLGGDEDDGPEA